MFSAILRIGRDTQIRCWRLYRHSSLRLAFMSRKSPHVAHSSGVLSTTWDRYLCISRIVAPATPRPLSSLLEEGFQSTGHWHEVGSESDTFIIYGG